MACDPGGAQPRFNLRSLRLERGRGPWPILLRRPVGRRPHRPMPSPDRGGRCESSRAWGDLSPCGASRRCADPRTSSRGDHPAPRVRDAAASIRRHLRAWSRGRGPDSAPHPGWFHPRRSGGALPFFGPALRSSRRAPPHRAGAPPAGRRRRRRRYGNLLRGGSLAGRSSAHPRRDATAQVDGFGACVVELQPALLTAPSRMVVDLVDHHVRWTTRGPPGRLARRNELGGRGHGGRGVRATSAPGRQRDRWNFLEVCSSEGRMCGFRRCQAARPVPGGDERPRQELPSCGAGAAQDKDGNRDQPASFHGALGMDSGSLRRNDPATR